MISHARYLLAGGGRRWNVSTIAQLRPGDLSKSFCSRMLDTCPFICSSQRVSYEHTWALYIHTYVVFPRKYIKCWRAPRLLQLAPTESWCMQELCCCSLSSKFAIFENANFQKPAQKRPPTNSIARNLQCGRWYIWKALRPPMANRSYRPRSALTCRLLPAVTLTA